MITYKSLKIMKDMKLNIFTLIYFSFIYLCKFVDSTSLDLKYSIKEESAIGYLIGNIKTDSRLTVNDSNPLIFQVYEDEEMKKYFKIVEKTGEFFVSGRIDRETICSFKEVGDTDPQKTQNCKLTLTVFVPKENWINVEINIQDINDHIPIFEPKSKVIEIDERVSVNFEVPLSLAKDLDSGQNNIQKYSLEDPSNLFEVKYESPFTLSLFLKSKLDYDTEDGKNYTLLLKACDGGYPVQCGHQELIIKVNDYNDNPPIFMKSEYLVNISEKTAVGTEIYQVNATDRDSGQYGTINYFMYESISNHQKSSDIAYFKISKSCGKIILNRKLDAKITPSFFMRLEAHDSGESPLMGQSVIKIFIEDTNDHTPQISIKPKPEIPGCLLSIFENNEKNSYIGLIIVTDGDVGLNGKVSCTLRDEDTKIVLKVSNNGEDRVIYSIIANHTFNREEDNIVTIKVTCRDSGQPSMIKAQSIDICIIDVNEYPPKVDQTIKSINISEDIPIGQEIFKLQVEDKDATRNLSFSFQNNKNNHFYIDKKYGKIKTKSNLDRETIEKFVLHILVEDNKQPGSQFTTSFSLTVSIIDANDNKPYLLNMSRVVNILEGIYDIKEKLFQIQAADDDLGDNGQVEFTLNYVESHSEKLVDKIFTIDRKNGEVFALKALDREKYDYFKISLLLTDKGNPPQTKEEIIMVNIMDRNDNEPIWMFPSVDNNVINVTKIIYPGQVITTIKAHDRDTLENANLTYTLLNVDPHHSANVFKIHETKGTIQVTEFLNSDKFILQFQASDNGNLPLKSKISSLTIRYWPMQSSSLLSGNDSISFTLIITMAVVTCLICMSLLIAIVVVRKRQNYSCTHNQSPSNLMFAINTDQNRSQFITLRNDPYYLDPLAGDASVLSNKWSHQYESKNDYSLSLQRNKMFLSDFQTSSLGEPLLQSMPQMHLNSPREILLRKSFRTVNGELDGSSGDSGHGISEEDQFHSEFNKNNDNHFQPNSNFYSTFTNSEIKHFLDNNTSSCPKMTMLPSRPFYGFHPTDNSASTKNNLPESKNEYVCLVNTQKQ